MNEVKENIITCGIVTKLKKSQNENFKIIQEHWKEFNATLKKLKINQNKGNWTKFGITYKENDEYLYLTSIPLSYFKTPKEFKTLIIPKGNYKIFTHKGKMENIKQTVSDIYINLVPKSNLKIENYEKIGFIHFEKYDYRFKWNNKDSIIDIYLPLKEEE